MTETRSAAALSFLADGGELGALIRAHDWQATSLGPPDAWPQSLRSALSICLNSSFPTAIYWGPELRLLYNQAWAPIPAERHPWALGRPAREVWADIWDVVGPQFEQVLATGSGFSTYDQMLPMIRGGRVHETWWNYSFTPIRGEEGQVVGIFNQGNETTESVLSRRRDRFLLELSDRLRDLSSPRDIIGHAQSELGAFLGANRVGYGEVDDEARFFTTERNWTDGTVPSREGTHDLAAFGPDIHRALREGEPLLIANVREDPRTNAPDFIAAFEAIDTCAAITSSLVKQGRMRAALYVHASTPRDWSEADARLVTDVAERTWATVERARAEASLRESEAQLRAIGDNLPGGMVYRIVMSGDGSDRRFSYVSRNCEQLTGVPADEVLRDPMLLYAVIAPEHREALAEAEAAAIAAMTPFNHECAFTRLGEQRWCRIISAPRRASDGTVAWDGLFIDITEAKAVEVQLRESEGKYHAIANSVDQLIWSTRSDGYHDYYNHRWYQYTGMPEGSTDGEEWNGMFHPDDQERAWAVWRHSLATGEPYEIEYRLRHRSGQYRWVIGRAQCVRDEDGRISRWFGTCTDIHDLKTAQQELRQLNDTLEERVAAAVEERARVEEALRQSQKLESMGQLTGGVAHDFNNLLTPIIGSLDMLQRRRVGDARAQRLIDGALQSAERAKTLVQRLLAFARRQPLQPSAVALAPLVEGMAELIGSTSGPRIRLAVDVPDTLPSVLADPNQLEMAILNLAVNARDAMPDGGRLTIAAAAAEPGQGEVPGVDPGAYVLLTVSDTGTGMDEATAARAIEPFFSTKGIGRGTGLGLSMVHGLVAQLGGALTIKSKPGLGTSVQLWLPVAREDVKVAARPETRPATAAAGRVLLVDDEALVRESTASMLEDLGFEVHSTGSAEEALAALRSGFDADLLITDHLMPGMSGTDLVRIVRAERPGTAALVISGYAEDDGLAPEFPRLTKPFREADLAASLADLRTATP
ncbi:MAG: PAS domain-containing protein [Allosphingosinicella sp.]|uniref:PAS domain-containing protein n=1 Tax=Allosphingosinicella sp. TaxID=2823234 RepID=UPI00393D2C3D